MDGLLWVVRQEGHRSVINAILRIFKGGSPLFLMMFMVMTMKTIVIMMMVKMMMMVTLCYLGDFRNLVDVNFCCAMGPPGGGRNPITARLQRHFNLLAFTEMEDPSKKKIFGTILKSWMRMLI